MQGGRTPGVKLRELPEQVSLLKDERMTDRIIERDPGIDSTYSRLASTVTVTTSSATAWQRVIKFFSMYPLAMCRQVVIQLLSPQRLLYVFNYYK